MDICRNRTRAIDSVWAGRLLRGRWRHPGLDGSEPLRPRISLDRSPVNLRPLPGRRSSLPGKSGATDEAAQQKAAEEAAQRSAQQRALRRKRRRGWRSKGLRTKRRRGWRSRGRRRKRRRDWRSRGPTDEAAQRLAQQRAADEAAQRLAQQRAAEEAAQGQAQQQAPQLPPDQVGPSQIAEAQRLLTSMGLNTGGANGKMGPRTQEMVRAFQLSMGLPSTGELTTALLETLRGTTPPVAARAKSLFTLAAEARNARRPGDATRLYEAALKLAPNDADGLLALGDLRRDANDLEAARRAYETLASGRGAASRYRARASRRPAQAATAVKRSDHGRCCIPGGSFPVRAAAGQPLQRRTGSCSGGRDADAR